MYSKYVWGLGLSLVGSQSLDLRFSVQVLGLKHFLHEMCFHLHFFFLIGSISLLLKAVSCWHPNALFPFLFSCAENLIKL
jgi:hypothetical protein